MSKREFTERDLAAARAIVSVYETGRAEGNYAEVAVLPDGAGISYGAHQATHRSQALLKVVARYVELCAKAKAGEGGCDTAEGLAHYLDDLASPSTISRLAHDETLKSLLRRAGRDSRMRQAQDETFDKEYMQKALAEARRFGFVCPLTLAVLYDSHIHGSYKLILGRVPPELKTAAREKEFVRRYVSARRAWLASAVNPVLRATVYRMEGFERLIARDNWQLAAPFAVEITQRGRVNRVMITADLLSAAVSTKSRGMQTAVSTEGSSPTDRPALTVEDDLSRLTSEPPSSGETYGRDDGQASPETAKKGKIDMSRYKPLVTSRVFIGVVLLVLGSAMPKLKGVLDVDQASALISAAYDGIAILVDVVGAVVAIIGRMNATHQISGFFTPPKGDTETQ